MKQVFSSHRRKMPWMIFQMVDTGGMFFLSAQQHFYLMNEEKKLWKRNNNKSLNLERAKSYSQNFFLYYNNRAVAVAGFFANFVMFGQVKWIEEGRESSKTIESFIFLTKLIIAKKKK